MPKLRDTTNIPQKKSTPSKSRVSMKGKENEVSLNPESDGFSNTYGSKSSLFNPDDLAKFVPYAFQNLTNNIQKIRVLKIPQGENVPVLPRKSLKKPFHMSSLAEVASEMQCKYEASSTSFSDILTLHAYYNSSNQLFQIVFNDCSLIPELIKILDMCFPFQKYLQKFVVRNSKLSQEVIFEISKALPNSNLTEVCLDDTFCDQNNYYVLLDAVCGLSRLSLNRCQIGDEALKEISLRLESGKPASQTLKILELSSNLFTDLGAKTIAKFLRSNRSVLHLNLAGNRITSEGGIAILNTLTRFLLDKNEIIDSRRAKMIYMFMNRSAKKSMGGPFKNSFTEQQTVIENDQVFSTGNFNLCSLNLAYNNLDYMFIKKLDEVLIYQSKNKITTGLLRIVLDGNEIPLNSVEQQSVHKCFYNKITSSMLLQKKVKCF